MQSSKSSIANAAKKKSAQQAPAAPSGKETQLRQSQRQSSQRSIKKQVSSSSSPSSSASRSGSSSSESQSPRQSTLRKSAKDLEQKLEKALFETKEKTTKKKRGPSPKRQPTQRAVNPAQKVTKGVTEKPQQVQTKIVVKKNQAAPLVEVKESQPLRKAAGVTKDIKNTQAPQTQKAQPVARQTTLTTQVKQQPKTQPLANKAQKVPAKKENEPMKSSSSSSSDSESEKEEEKSEDPPKNEQEDEEMKSEKSNEEESESNSSSSEEEEEKEPIELSYKLYECIKNDDKVTLSKGVISEKMADQDEVENKVCKVCFQEVYYPNADKAISKEQKEDSARKLSDGECLYLMVYCKHCQLNVHWNCIGTDKDLVRKYKNKKPYYFFECDRCKFKELQKENPGKYKFNFSVATTSTSQQFTKHEQFQCIACESNKGILKSFNIQVQEIQQEEEEEDKSQESKSMYTFFYHPICAMSFPETFKQVITPHSVCFTLRDTSLSNPILQSKRERAHLGAKRPRSNDSCTLCKSPYGLLIQSESERPDKSFQPAHAFCILDQQYISEQVGDEKYDFCYQVLMEENNNFQPRIHVRSEHQKLKSCMCRGTVQSSNMMSCDACNNWFHKQCINFEDNNIEVDNYTCLKCFEWQDHLNRNLIAMNFQYKDFKSFLNKDQTYWKGIDSLVNYMEDCDIAIQLPVKYFEHCIILKTWHSLSNQIQNNVVSEDLFNQHIEEAKYIFPLINTDPVSKALKAKKDKIEEIIADGCAELVIMDLLNSTNNSPAASQIAILNKEQREIHNKEIVHKAEELEKKCLEEAKLINESVLDLQKYSQKSQLLQEAYDLLRTRNKPPISDVKTLFEKVKSINFHLEDGFSTIEALNSMIGEYERWFAESMGKFKMSTPEEDTVRERIEKIKSRKVGAKRQDFIHRLFKQFLDQKTSIKDAHGIQESAKLLKVDVSEELSYLDQLISVIKEIEKDNEKFSKNPQKYQRALNEATEKLIQACCFPIKSDKIDGFLETWHKSALWTVQAKNFLLDKLTDDQQIDLNTKMDIDEGNTETPLKKSNAKADFIWSLERAEKLLSEFEGANPPLFVDLEISKKVKVKVDCISKLKKAIGSTLLDEMSDIKTLQNFIAQLESMQTTDFTLEIHRIKDKIKLVQDVIDYTENKKNSKQSLEMLESLDNRVQSLADNEQYPANIVKPLIKALGSRLSQAREIKKSFYDILATKCQDFFTLNVDKELRAIVHKGEQQYHIDMSKEQKIVDNYDYSKGWFMETFDRLKKCTESLHKIDFTNFVQLSTVLKEEKECVALLKNLTKSPEQLVGAAQNLWRSIFGVKWLFDATRLLKYDLKAQSVAPTQEIELKMIIDLDVRASELLNLDYNEEVRKATPYSPLFREFSKLVTCIKQFDEKFGNYHKLLKTLEANLDRLEEFKKECENLTQVLNAHKITSASGELELLSKIHTYIDFLQRYQQLTQNINPEEEKEPKEQVDFKLPYSKAMLIQQLARDSQIPEDLSILKRLRDSVARFEKFQREYSDYKRYRTRLIKSKGQQYSANTLLDQRFTTTFINKLIEEQANLQIEGDSQDDESFDKEMLEGDLAKFALLQKEAEGVFAQIEEDEVQMGDDMELRESFNLVKTQISAQPVYEKELHVKIAILEWLYSSSDMLNSKGEQLSIGTWDAKIKQADNQMNAIPRAQQPQILKNLMNHSLYQRVLWEVDQARQCIDFAGSHRTIMKGLAGRYLQESQKQAFNVSYAFRNKPSKTKVEKIFESAKRSKIDLTDEIRQLGQWIKDCEQFTTAYSEGTLFTQNSYERLKEIAKQIYISPIDMCDLYLKLKPRLDIAEAIKLDLKRIVQDHEGIALQIQKNQINRPQRKLRYSRISDSLQIYQKECKIQGIKEIDQLLAKIQRSKDLLTQVSALVSTITQENNDTAAIIDKCKDLLAQLELDMEKKELEVRRQVFEAELRHLIFSPHLAEGKKRHKIDIDQFRSTYEKDFEMIKSIMQDEEMENKFAELKNQVHEFLRKLNRVQTKDQLQEVEKEILQECQYVDFSQILADKEAFITLGKRPSKNDASSSSSEEDDSPPAAITMTKRQKTSEVTEKKKATKTREESSSSSSSEGESSSGQSSSSGDESSSSQEESSEESKTTRGLASERPRRKINPNMSSDFIYSKSTIKAHEKIAKQKDESSSSSEDSEVEKEERKDSKSKKQKLKEKKRQLDKQLEEHRKQKKLEEQAIFQKELQTKRAQYVPEGVTVYEDAGINPVSLLKQDADLQRSLQNFKLKIREQSKKKIKESFQLPGSVFSTLNPEEIESITVDFEDEISKKHPEVDHFYRKRITDICTNITLLKDYKDISDLIAIKKALSFGKLLQNQHAFKEDVQKLDLKIKERRAQLKIKATTSGEVQGASVIPSVAFPVQQPVVEEVKGVDPQSLVQVKIQPAEDLAPTSQSHMSIDDNDDLESCESNPALFSDGEDAKPMNAVQSILQSVKNQEHAQKKQRYQSQQPIQDPSRTPMTPVQQSQVPETFTLQGVRLQYNPYEIFETKHLGGGGFLKSGGFMQQAPLRKPSEPILYDPSRSQQKSHSKQLNMAATGSLLKVWDGSLELAKDHLLKCELYSLQDIALYQQLPEIPQTLTLKGKAKLMDVTTHFLRLKRDKRLLKGWVTRRGTLHQENNDRYCRLFEELDVTEKSALFNMYQNTTLYLVPVTPKNKDFILQMGIDLEKVKEQALFDSSKVLPEESKVRTEEEIKQLKEETHLYAYFCQIKQAFTNKSNFLNPDVLMYALPPPARPQRSGIPFKSQQEANFSPITSDEEGKPPVKKQQQTFVKQEDQQQQQHYPYGQQVQPQQQQFVNRVPQDPRLEMRQQQEQQFYPSDPRLAQQQRFPQQPVKQMEEDMGGVSYPVQMGSGAMHNMPHEDDDDVDIDDLIEGFKKNEYNLQSIQAKLMTVIHKVKGEKEVKLTQFLQELIFNLKNSTGGGPSTAPQAMVKSEEMPHQPDPNVSLGYSYPAGLGSNMIPQQQMGGFRPPSSYPGIPNARYPQASGQPGFVPQQQAPFIQQQPFGQPGHQQQFLRPPPNQFYPGGPGGMYGQQGPFLGGPADMMPGTNPMIRPPPGQPQQFGQQSMIRPPPTQQQQQQQMNYYQQQQQPNQR